MIKIIDFVALFILTIMITPLVSAYEDGEKVKVGTNNPIELTFRDPNKSYSMASFIGTAGSIGSGDVGQIYQSFSGHAIKMIPIDKFPDGDEIRISEIASKIKVGPVYYGAWVTANPKSENSLYVAIEMENLPGNKISAFIGIKARDKGRQEIAALENLFRNRTKDGNTYFFDRLFTMLKELAEHKISYGDLHYGNMIKPDLSWEDVKLIDFGDAALHETVAEAARATLKAPYVAAWINFFNGYATKAKVAKEALQWLNDQAYPNTK